MVKIGAFSDFNRQKEEIINAFSYLCTDIRKFVKTFWKKKSVIDTRLYNQILAKFECTKGSGLQQRSRYGYILSRKGELYTRIA